MAKVIKMPKVKMPKTPKVKMPKTPKVKMPKTTSMGKNNLIKRPGALGATSGY